MINSAANEKLKLARRVRDGREAGLILIEGERLIEESLQSKLNLTACFHCPDLKPRAQAILGELARRNLPIYATADAALATVSDTVNTQGLIVLAERPKYSVDQVFGTKDLLVVGLDAVQDPGNFGAIVRTAEAAGASGVIALKGSVDAFAPKSLRGAMGSAFRLPIVSDLALEALFDSARAAKIQVVATAADAKTVYTDYDWRRPTLVIFGNEARGVSAEVMERCDDRLRIPLRPPVESLNIAAAAAAILFEAARQRKKC